MLVGGAALHAASPDLSDISPRGAQRGAETTLHFEGTRLAAAQAGLQRAQTLENKDGQKLDQLQAQIDALTQEYQSALPKPLAVVGSDDP